MIGICSHWWPELPGNGKSILTVSVNSGMTLGTAAVILLLKPLLTALFLRAGAVGGMLTPSLATGAALGSVMRAGGQRAGRDHAVSVPVVSLACAAGVLAITQRAPVWAAIFVWELARPPWWLLVVFLAAALAAHGVRIAVRAQCYYCGVLTQVPASPTMPTGTGPVRLDVLHARTGRDDRGVLQDRQHGRTCSTAVVRRR